MKNQLGFPFVAEQRFAMRNKDKRRYLKKSLVEKDHREER